MRTASIRLYKFLVAREKLKLNTPYEVFRGCHLTLLSKKKGQYIFTISKKGQFLLQAIDDIKNYGKVRMKFLEENKTAYTFTVVKQQFIPTVPFVRIR